MSVLSEIRKRYFNESVKAIAGDLGLTERQVTHRAYSMGLKKNRVRSKKSVLEVAKGCDSYMIFREDHPSDYQYALMKGFVDEIREHFGKINTAYETYEDSYIRVKRSTGASYAEIAEELSLLNKILGRPERTKISVYQRHIKLIDKMTH
jgi:hypothetical protein